MKHQKNWSRFFLVAAIVTMALIFYFSAQKGVESQALSDGFTLRVAKLIRPDYARMPVQARVSFLELLSTLVRKSAHFLEYALLGFNLMGWLALRSPSVSLHACRLQAWLAATLYAVTDELHQLFINERSAQVMDVAIDSAGALSGILLMSLLLLLLARWRGREEASGNRE